MRRAEKPVIAAASFSGLRDAGNSSNQRKRERGFLYMPGSPSSCVAVHFRSESDAICSIEITMHYIVLAEKHSIGNNYMCECNGYDACVKGRKGTKGRSFDGESWDADQV